MLAHLHLILYVLIAAEPIAQANVRQTVEQRKRAQQQHDLLEMVAPHKGQKMPVSPDLIDKSPEMQLRYAELLCVLFQLANTIFDVSLPSRTASRTRHLPS